MHEIVRTPGSRGRFIADHDWTDTVDLLADQGVNIPLTFFNDIHADEGDIAELTTMDVAFPGQPPAPGAVLRFLKPGRYFMQMYAELAETGPSWTYGSFTLYRWSSINGGDAVGSGGRPYILPEVSFVPTTPGADWLWRTGSGIIDVAELPDGHLEGYSLTLNSFGDALSFDAAGIAIYEL